MCCRTRWRSWPVGARRPPAISRIRSSTAPMPPPATVHSNRARIHPAGTRARIVRPCPAYAGGLMEQVGPRDEHRREWVIKRHLSTDGLKEYVARIGIERSQVI